MGAGLVGLAIGRHLARLDPEPVAAIPGRSLANYAVRAVRWQALTRAAGLKVPLARNALYYVAGFAFTVTPGKLGEAVRLWLLRRHHHVPYRRTLGLLAVDRVADAVPLLALCLPGAAGFAGHMLPMAGVAAIVLAGLALLLRTDWLAGLVNDRPLATFAYRGLRPAFHDAPLVLEAWADGEVWRLRSLDAGGRACTTAEATFG